MSFHHSCCPRAFVLVKRNFKKEGSPSVLRTLMHKPTNQFVTLLLLLYCHCTPAECRHHCSLHASLLFQKLFLDTSKVFHHIKCNWLLSVDTLGSLLVEIKWITETRFTMVVYCDLLRVLSGTDRFHYSCADG